MRACLPLLAVLSACKGEDAPTAAPTPPAALARAIVDEPPSGCQKVPFAESTPVPEASGAAWMTIDGTRALVVVSDSGNKGAYGVVDADSGATREQGLLPLGDAGEDNEGAATRIVDGEERLVALTSSGWIREWKREGRGFALVGSSYSIGDSGDPRCTIKKTNCGRDYEGLCLANKPADGGECAGFGLSRNAGTLDCLVMKDGAFAVDPSRSIKVGEKGRLADCAFSDDDRLFVGANMFGTNDVVRIDGWRDPATAKIESLGTLGIGFAEVVAARGDSIYRMSDTGGAPSLMARFRCPLR